MIMKKSLIIILVLLFLVGCRGIQKQEISDPELVLTNYIIAMENKDTDIILEHYGGNYEILDEIDPKNRNNALKDYLTSIPALHLNKIIEKKEISVNEYEFVVNFAISTGEIFETKNTTSTNSTFKYPVKKIDGKFKVMELPPYQA